jgi:glycosyltransferase involved in cell wall biosynthesis
MLDLEAQITAMRKRVCILSFSPIYRDARVLRQIKYLSNYYDLNVIGYGESHPLWKNVKNIGWHVIETPLSPWIVKLSGLMFLSLGRLKTFFYDHWYDHWYWRKRHHRVALEMATANKCDAYHANDWEALPIAAEAAKKNNARLVFDAHEYAPLELENRWYWKFFFRQAIIYFIEKYAPQVDAAITVAPLISERYRQEFSLDPIVVLNAPEKVSLPMKKLDCDNIRLIHHGGVVRDRGLEKLIETLALCDRRYGLHFMLLNNDPNYLDQLKALAAKLAPGRVTFHNPVPPEKIVQRISEYDIGFYLLVPCNYNNSVALPNKFFDFIAAGLAVCIGPSPSMAEVVRKYGCGCVAQSFDPRDTAKTLNHLTLEQLSMMRIASRKAAEDLNADKEMGKLVDLYDKLFNRH